jgi:hypothetical protein
MLIDHRAGTMHRRPLMQMTLRLRQPPHKYPTA